MEEEKIPEEALSMQKLYTLLKKEEYESNAAIVKRVQEEAFKDEKE